MTKLSMALWDWFFVLDQEDGTKVVTEELKQETFEVVVFISAFVLLAIGVCSMVSFS